MYDPKYDGMTVYLVRPGAVKRGDVLLTRDKNGSSWLGRRQADAIAIGSRGDFNHALICTLPPTFAEAVQTGVQNLSIQICFSHAIENVRVLRPADPAIAEQAAKWAAASLGRPYSIARAIMSVTPIKDRSQRDGIFCSALVAAAFKAVKAPGFDTVNPLKVTPATLQHHPGFMDVTSEVFYPALAPKNVESMSALDGNRRITPSSAQTAYFHAFHTWMAPAMREIAKTVTNHTIEVPSTFLNSLPFCLHMLQRHQVHALDNSTLVAVLQLDKDASARLSDGAFRDILRGFKVLEEPELQYLIEQSFQPKPDIHIDGLKETLKNTLGQIKERSGILNDPGMPREVSQFWDCWLDFTEDMIEALRRRKSIMEEVLLRLHK